MAKRKPKVKNLANIEKYLTAGTEHYNKHTFEIYKKAIKNGLFDGPETPLRFFSDYGDIFVTHRENFLQAAEQFFQAMQAEGLTVKQKVFITDNLISWFEHTVFDDEKRKEYSLNRVAEILRVEKEKLQPHKKQKNENPFDWDQTLKHLETLPDTKEK